MTKFLIIFLLIFTFVQNSYGIEVKIIKKIKTEIITNLDISNEEKYLLILNKNLSNLDKSEIYEISKNSLIKETIKQIEIKRNFKNIKNIKLDNAIYKEFIDKTGFESKNEFIVYINKINLSEEFVKQRIIFEKLWNSLIVKKFSKNIKIDKEKIKQRIKYDYDNLEKMYEYNISEILIDKNMSILEEMTLSIKNNGFETTAYKFSNASSSKYGGNIGWVKDIMITKEIRDLLSKIKVGETTKIIELQNGYLIFKKNLEREYKKKLDFDLELENRINQETNKQLNQFSNIYLKKLEQNITTNEY